MNLSWQVQHFFDLTDLMLGTLSKSNFLLFSLKTEKKNSSKIRRNSCLQVNLILYFPNRGKIDAFFFFLSTHNCLKNVLEHINSGE